MVRDRAGTPALDRPRSDADPRRLDPDAGPDGAARDGHPGLPRARRHRRRAAAAPRALDAARDGGEGGGRVNGLALTVALALVAALNLYALSGGADYGGGVWD